MRVRPRFPMIEEVLPLVLWEMRQGAHLSQAELGRRTGLSDKAIHTYENGRTVPHLSHLERICLACGKTLLSFFKELDRTQLAMQARQKHPWAAGELMGDHR